MAPPPETMTENEPMTPLLTDRPQAVILDDKGASRPKRTTFNFVEPGQYQREGQRIRMKAQLEKLQAEISTISRKTGITSATQLAKLVPKTDTKSSEPDVEWWV